MRLSLRKIHPALRLQNLLPLAIYTVLVIMLTMFVSSLLTDHRHPSVISTRLPQFGTPAPARGAPGSSQVKQEREGMPKPEGKHYRPLPKSPAVKRMLEWADSLDSQNRFCGMNIIIVQWIRLVLFATRCFIQVLSTGQLPVIVQPSGVPLWSVVHKQWCWPH